jgi:hypothetical protein
MKFTINKASTKVTLKDGRQNAWSIEVPSGISRAAIEGVLAAQDADTITADELTTALAAAAARKGSVIPDDYRVTYGVDQNCGDDIAQRLKDATTGTDGKADMAAVEAIAGANGLGDKFDQWATRGLNNGMVRMNLGNMLRAKARKGEEVAI